MLSVGIYILYYCPDCKPHESRDYNLLNCVPLSMLQSVFLLNTNNKGKNSIIRHFCIPGTFVNILYILVHLIFIFPMGQSPLLATLYT